MVAFVSLGATSSGTVNIRTLKFHCQKEEVVNLGTTFISFCQFQETEIK